MTASILGAVWAFCWGLAAASGALVGVILGLLSHLRHGAIAAFISHGAGVLLSAASFKVATEALISAGAASTVGGIVAGAATFSIANAALATANDRKRCGECKPQSSEAETPGSDTSNALGTALDAVPAARLCYGSLPSCCTQRLLWRKAQRTVADRPRLSRSRAKSPQRSSSPILRWPNRSPPGEWRSSNIELRTCTLSRCLAQMLWLSRRASDTFM